MCALKLVYSDGYYLPIGAHVFPAEKYRLVHGRLLKDRVAVAADFVEPKPARDEDILLVHTPDYVRKLKTGTLTAGRPTVATVVGLIVIVFWIPTASTLR